MNYNRRIIIASLLSYILIASCSNQSTKARVSTDGESSVVSSECKDKFLKDLDLIHQQLSKNSSEVNVSQEAKENELSLYNFAVNQASECRGDIDYYQIISKYIASFQDQRYTI